MFSSISSRLLLGCLLVMALRSDAAPLETDDLCTPQGIQNFLNHTSDKDDIDLAYEHCRSDFLDRNAMSPVVKRTIDDWVGTDLSKAETNQIFLAYELALLGPRPDQLDAEFEGQCRQMVQRFQSYRDTIEPLTAQMEIDLDSLLTEEGDEEIEEEERDLLNYVQYAQFCKSLLEEAHNEQEE